MQRKWLDQKSCLKADGLKLWGLCKRKLCCPQKQYVDPQIPVQNRTEIKMFTFPESLVECQSWERSGFTQVCKCTLLYVINPFLFFCLSCDPPTSVPHAPDFLSLSPCLYECVSPLSCLSSLVYWKWHLAAQTGKWKNILVHSLFSLVWFA